MKKIYQKVEILFLYSFFFLSILLINYKSLILLYHGSREIHLYVIGVVVLHSIISIFLIHFFFLGSNTISLVKEKQKFIRENFND